MNRLCCRCLHALKLWMFVTNNSLRAPTVKHLKPKHSTVLVFIHEAIKRGKKQEKCTYRPACTVLKQS